MNILRVKNVVFARSLFTLMEVLIAMGIIMLLSAMAVPMYQKIFAKTKKQIATAQIHNLEISITDYQISTGKLPKDFNSLIQNDSGDKKWDGPYIKNGKVPKDPWGNDYVYELTSDGSGYKITSYGSDGAPGGSGYAEDITN